MMEYLPGFPDDVVAVMWHDRPFDKDSPARLDPTVRDKLAGRHDVRLLARYSSHDDVRSLHPDIEDLMRGIGQWRDFSRIAIVTDEASIRHAVQFFGPFFHGPIRVFRNSQGAEARAWLRQSGPD